MRPAQPATESADPPNPIHPNAALALAVPAELVEAIADRVASRLAAVTPESDGTAASDQGTGRLALSKAEAAESLGVSVDHLERHVLPELRIIRSGRLRLIPVDELKAWLGRSAARALVAAA